MSQSLGLGFKSISRVTGVKLLTCAKAAGGISPQTIDAAKKNVLILLLLLAEAAVAIAVPLGRSYSRTGDTRSLDGEIGG
jgi:hypothetical protein